MHDFNGTPLKEGDRVLMPCVVKRVTSSEENFCNVEVETILGRRPDGLKNSFGSINTGQLVKVSGDTPIGM